MNTSPLLLVAAMASAWQNANPLALQRLQQHLRLQQQNDQTSPTKEEKPRTESKKSKQPKKEDKSEERTGSSSSTSPRSQSNSTWLPASSPTQGSHKVRKLKLYSADEKIDIIDYAKVIGNRAAGREFNVAESSIREWRKNEDRLRKQSETASNGNQRVELNHTDLIKKLDDQLVEFVDNTDTDWYGIRDLAQESWPKVIKGTVLDGSQDADMQITMGWVARFMKRNESRVRRIAPPVIATANSANNHNGSVSMVRRTESSFGSSTDVQSEKATIVSSHTNSSNPSPTSSPSPALLSNTTSRRKCAQPKRAANATLMLTPDSEKPPTDEEHKDEDEPAEKKARTEEEEENEEKPVNETDSSIKVC
ncbi:HTH CENPB-type domain-containing protein [Aphelenchoides bicaudatus]|nr:HTH CENPB-type domain-containing protein [Aphelenchoides bicaudatus]